ncbi:hypothetical protein N7535_008345 [Penicillium sp. DV-2018c]|nr:hypothetical protein N7461_002102 [Penicillium sp. DV-2018c]KAJ5563181.1 hypothetical protein N7535_008345 [Penicillium sp. DV-2018c]
MRGHPSTENYDTIVPYMYYGMFSCIGSFISTTTDPAGLRLFLLNITTYNNARGSPPDQNVASYVNLKVLAAIPNTARWTNFRTPNTGRQLQVRGDWIGYYPFEGKDIFCIAVSDISYVSSNSGPTATRCRTDHFRRARNTPCCQPSPPRRT